MEIILTTVPQLKQLIAEVLISTMKDIEPWASKESEVKYLTTKEAALIVRKTPGALRQIVHRGQIPSIKRGNSLLFLKSDLISWVETGRRDSDTDYKTEV